VLEQRDSDAQHIVQDAGSDDETLDVLRSFGDRIRWTSEDDLGQSDGLNRALEKATGQWVAWLNADEFYLPDGLAVLVDEGEKHGVDVVYGDCATVDEAGRLIALRSQHPFSRRVLRLYGPFIDSSSVIIRRSKLPRRPWDPSLRLVMDWALYLSLAADGATFRYVDYPVGAFRQHPDQASAGPGTPETRHVRERYRIPTGKFSRRGGKVLHRMRKLAAGSYRRQMRAKALQGRDLRWFRDPSGYETFRLLLDRCYGLRAEIEGARRAER
jgi:glycosyltransferase involved in cell wall biosynthesis